MPTQGQNLSQHLVIDSDYLMIDPGIPSSQQISQSSQFEIDNRPPSQTLTQLNQSLIDQEETVFATSALKSQTLVVEQMSLEFPPQVNNH